MRALLILLVAVTLGLTVGYAWSGMMSGKARAPALPEAKIDAAKVATASPTEEDNEWEARAEDNGTSDVVETTKANSMSGN